MGAIKVYVGGYVGFRVPNIRGPFRGFYRGSRGTLGCLGFGVSKD